MREQFQAELDAVSATLVEMAGMVKTAMENATTALLTADLTLAEKVIADDLIIDEAQHELDEINRVIGTVEKIELMSLLSRG